MPVRADTSASHACVHLTRPAGASVPFVSRSSTGGRSPAAGCATSTKWSACAIALATMPASPEPPGRAKWYAPKRIPIPFVPARLIEYVGSVSVVPSVAFAKRNE